MKYKTGDKVKFLNEAGSGIVKGYSGPKLVLVETADGFDIPYPERELIPWEPFPGGGELDEAPRREVVQDIADMPDMTSPSDDTSTLNAAAKQLGALFLVFHPYKQSALTFGELDLYVANATTVALHLAVYSELDTGYKLLFDIQVQAGSKKFVATVSRDDLNLWDKLQVMLLPLVADSSKLYQTLSLPLRLKGSRFFKETAYEYSHFVEGKALIAKLIDEKEWPLLAQKTSDKEVKYAGAAVASPSAGEPDEALIKPYLTGEGKAEVDMHIWELEPEYEHLSRSEIFDIQLRFFYRILDSAKAAGLKELVVIHGVGTGKLKKEISEILSERGITFRPASIRDYGVGAMHIFL